MADKMQIEDKSEANWRLTGKNLKFLQNLVKGLKVGDAHKLAGYSGNIKAGYALKWKLKSQLAKLFETEGISKDRYLADLVRLLALPCVDRSGNEVATLNFAQYMEVRKLLREELPSTKVATPQITAFVVERYSKPEQDKVSDVIEITPISGRAKPSNTITKVDA